MSAQKLDHQFSGELFFEQSLADYSSWKVGGIANKIYKPANLLDLSDFLVTLPSSEPILWLGLGSNTLIRDKGFNGTVIITQGGLKELTLTDELTVYAESGVSCASMARFCARNNLADAEFLAGIPGTIGGALRMNAGCFNGETWNFVTSVSLMRRDGTIYQKPASDFNIAYRSVEGLNSDEWFVGGTFKFNRGEKSKSLDIIRQLLDRRAATQPTNDHNCGSVFRNPPGNFAARLIENCGLKGFKIGGAVVSPKHANFIINDGTAIAHDIETLIAHVAATVEQHTSIKLHREVHIIGEV